MQKVTDAALMEAQKKGYAFGNTVDSEGDLAEILRKKLYSNGYNSGDIRHYPFAVGFFNACTDQLRRKVAELRCQKKCPHDTNGDDDCGRPLCPHCGKS